MAAQVQLDALQEQLTESQRLATIGTIAAVIAHEFNNLLTPIVSYSQYALTSAESDKPDMGLIKKALSKSFQSSEKAGKICASMLSLARGESTFGGVSVQMLVDETLMVLARDPQKDGIALRVQVQPGLLVDGDPVQLEQVMLNLLINAGESMPPRRFNARVRIGAELSADGSMIRLGITDNGRGMTPAVQRRAPHLFFTTKPRRMGTGLGLPLARKVALRAGGDIEIRSALGKGTTVVLVMPASKVLSSDPAANQDARLRSASISVRDQRTSSLIAQILVKAGFQVRPMTAKTQGTLDIWVTDPTPGALASAAGWRAGNPSRMLVVVGTPAKRYLGKWAAAGATVIDHPDDFESIRHALSTAILNKKRTP